jgi:microcystin-dependent protein
MSRPAYTIQAGGAGGNVRQIATQVGWRLLTIVCGCLGVLALAMAGWSLSAAMDAEHRQNALILKENADVNALTEADSALLAELLAVNSTIFDNLAFLEAALNITNTNGNTFLQEVQAEIASSVASLEAEIALRVITVNSVSGDNATHNIDLLAGPGITVTPHPLSNTITLDNSGLLSLVAGNAGLSFSTPNGDVIGYNTGVLTLSGVAPPSLGGNIEVLGVGMLSVYGDTNTSSLTVDASLLVVAVTNLQTQTETQQAEIADLQLNVTTLETQITNMQLAEFVIEQALNGSVTTLNMTLTDLLSTVYDLQSQLAALQAQEANETQSSVIPTGAMFPWTGAPSTCPEGYLLCDGSEYVSGDYPALYAVIGTLYCEGNCSLGSFRVPAMGGRIPVGLGGGGLFQAAVGTEVGAEQQTLTTPNLPSHSHSASTVAAGTHSHTALTARVGDLDQLIDAGDNSGATFSSFGAVGSLTNGYNVCDKSSIAVNSCGGTAHFPASTTPYFQPLTGAASAAAGRVWGDHSHSTDSQGSHTHTVNVGNTGSGTAFSVVQPSLTVQYIIKT